MLQFHLKKKKHLQISFILIFVKNTFFEKSFQMRIDVKLAESLQS